MNAGDIVYLKSGGPPMCVEETFEHAGTVRVVWISPDGHPQEVYFSKVALSTAPAYWWPSPQHYQLNGGLFQAQAQGPNWHYPMYYTGQTCQIDPSVASQMNR